MKRQVVGLILVSLLVPACGAAATGNEEVLAPRTAGENFTREHLELFLLQPSQLPPGYQIKVENDASGRECSEGRKDWQVAFRQEVFAEGLLACRNATYEKQGAHITNAPASGALLFETAAGASRALPAVRQISASLVKPTESPFGGKIVQTEIPLSGLGDETPPGVSFKRGDLELVAYFWRIGNVVAFVIGSDALGDMDGGSLLETAKQINNRASQR